MATRSTPGNPPTAGRIAFGAGLPVALMPRTRAEKRAAQLMEQADGMIQPVGRAVREAAQALDRKAGEAARRPRRPATECTSRPGRWANTPVPPSTTTAPTPGMAVLRRKRYPCHTTTPEARAPAPTVRQEARRPRKVPQSYPDSRGGRCSNGPPRSFSRTT
ncbi:hypothetical protein GCM10009525_44770 [Streptosporangium amethystogenes subsp. fukuiense]